MARSALDDVPSVLLTFAIVAMVLIAAVLVSYVALIAIPAYIA